MFFAHGVAVIYINFGRILFFIFIFRIVDLDIYFFSLDCNHEKHYGYF